MSSLASTLSSTFLSTSSPALSRRHHQRLRQLYRSAGWPCADPLEVDLLAAGLLERRCSPEGHETLRLTDAGIQALAQSHAGNRAARTPHEALVARVAEHLSRAGRLTWRGLMLRAPLPGSVLKGPHISTPESKRLASEPPPATTLFGAAATPMPDHRWCVAMPDVFSIRRSSVEAYLEPLVHEIKVSRADLLGDLKKPAKRAAYLAVAGACWYVLGVDAKGRPIAQPHEVPPECGVLQLEGAVLVVAREAPRRAVEHLPFHVWMALAQAGPAIKLDAESQELL
jgi:hypothetical protein